VEAKQVAQQEAERAKFIVEKAEQDKKSAIIRAEGEAKSAQLLGEAIQNNPSFLTLRKIEAAREIAATIAASPNRVLLDSNSLLLNLQDLEINGAAAAVTAPFAYHSPVISSRISSSQAQRKEMMASLAHVDWQI
jgi:regulator of protease activity HflC (stomatin/prohibitin superfamily)